MATKQEPKVWDRERQLDRFRTRARARIEAVRLPEHHPARDYAVDWIASIVAGTTALGYAQHLARWLDWCGDRRIDPFVVDSRRARTFVPCIAYLAPKSRDAVLGCLRSFYEDAVDDKMVPSNPFRRIRERSAVAKEPTPALTLAQFESVLSEVDRDGRLRERPMIAARDFALIYLTGRMGLRAAELSTLTWGSIRGDVSNRVLHVHGKGAKSAVLGLPQDVADVLSEWRDIYQDALGKDVESTDPVFARVSGGGGLFLHRDKPAPVGPKSISSVISERLTDVGIQEPRTAAHCLRATAATLAHENGANLLAIMRLLRHSNPATTAGYIRRLEASRAEAASTWRPHALERHGALGTT